MHRFKISKALQIKLSTSNCGQVCITACGQAPMACHRWPRGGVGPARKGHGNGSPANIFILFF
jgi:hypothetical protein